jgi:hypothetical protein
MRLVLVCVLVAACASARIPSTLRGYDILVEGRDEQSGEFAQALRAYGFRVRRNIKGGSRPTAALISYLFPPVPGEPVWLYVRLADTRTGVIVGAGMVQLDSLTGTAKARAAAAVQALVAP